MRGFPSSISFLVFLIIGVNVMDGDQLWAQSAYQKPPKEVLEILDAPSPPSISLSPTKDRLLLLQSERYPPIADIAQPILRLAGMRINPRTNGPHYVARNVRFELMTISTGKSQPLDFPKNSRISNLRWSADGKQFAFTNTLADGIELWIGDASSGKLRQVPKIRINDTYGEAVQWMPDNKTLLCQTIPESRGDPPAAANVPTGPLVLESSGKVSPVRTYQDLLQNAHDEKLFEYYSISQLVLVDSESLEAKAIGRPGLIRSADPSPNGQYLLVQRNHRPYSYLLPAGYFPRDVEIWDLEGKLVVKLASLPLADQIPIEGVPTGPRSHNWMPTDPATVVWVEALDEGDPRKKVTHRDKLLALAEPFKDEPREWFRTEHRYSGISWAEGGMAFVREYDRDRRWQRTFLVDSKGRGQSPKLIWDLSTQDRYKDPGSLVMRTLSNGMRIVHQHDGNVFLVGSGANPKGDMPFLDRMELATMKTQRLFQSAEKMYESPVAILNEEGTELLTRHESLVEPPNYFLRTVGKDGKQALTNYKDPTPTLRQVKKQLVRYQRSDGVPLSFTLYLPPDYKEGQRLPAVVWAYPREYTDVSTAGQVSGSPYRFTTLSGMSHLFFLTQGYAILDGATMPVVGDPETVNNTYIKQVVDSAKAAIDKADEMGVIDRNRVGVGGHSYGAFMTANLLAHCDLFRAGIARSGAYNRTLTPFGFQSERRTLWEAPEVYLKISPFLYAHKINEPILLIHGEMDNNSGTFPMQSERMYHAIKGNGGTVRLVMLPHESHGYQARESIEHTLYEMIRWFDQHVKNADGNKQ